MGGSATSTTPGGTFNPQAEVRPATRATAADIAAFDASQAQNKRIAQGLGSLAQGIQDIDFSSSEPSNAMQSQDQSEKYLKLLQMLQNKQSTGLTFVPNAPFQIRSSGEEAVSNAWANAGKTLASSAIGGVGKMYGM